MKQINYNWKNTEGLCTEIIRQLQKSDWYPDYIVGVTRGGLIPAVLISHWLDIPMETLNIKFDDVGISDKSEHNCWMAEDAFGYIPTQERSDPTDVFDTRSKKILIVDDINRSGEVIEWIKQDWQASCMPNDSHWDQVWHHNVRFATLVNDESASEQPDYAVVEINRNVDQTWVNFAWENWWNKK